MKKSIIIVFTALCVGYGTFAQIKDTVHLHPIDITANKSSFQIKEQFNSGKKNQYFDSLNNFSNIGAPITSLLNYQSGLFVKDYGPGAINTISLRGGNAQQTAILWQGININNPMLGQSDLSQMPAGLFEQQSVEYGSATALWGSGAINGALKLQSNLIQDVKEQIQLTYRYGSFNTHHFLSKVLLNASKFKFQIKPYMQSSDNNYFIGDSLRLKNAAFNSRGMVSDFLFQINRHHKITFNTWYHQGSRLLPNTYYNTNTYATQQDRNFRNVLEHIYSDRRLSIATRAVYLQDNIDYANKYTYVDSKSKVHTLMWEENANYQRNQNMNILFGYQWTYNLAVTNNYLNNQALSKYAMYAGLNYIFKKTSTYITFRKEFSNLFSNIPFTGNIGTEYELMRFLKIKTQASLFYRMPTLNDLFWKDGGDINLKPERGYQYEGGLYFQYRISNFNFKSEMTAFNKLTNNWILWVPKSNGTSSPMNIATVWSRGTETDNYILFVKNKYKIKLQVNSAYIISTVQASAINNDASIGRQLIYTPRYNINGSFSFQYANVYTQYFYQYIGYRFTSSDNLQWLEPYQVSNIVLGYTLKKSNHVINISTGINNLFNIQYMVVLQRPMPGRNYFITINYQYHKPKNQ